MKLRVQWGDRTKADFTRIGIPIMGEQYDWSQPIDFKTGEGPLVVSDLAETIETLVTQTHYQHTGEQIDMQAYAFRSAKVPDRELPWVNEVSEFFAPGDTVIIEAQAVTEAMMRKLRGPRFSEDDLNKFRGMLRFGLNDRVLCYCGPRWLAGAIVGTGVEQEDELLPYVVKTDALPGLPSNTISVPSDDDEICRQEVCFDPMTELHLIKCAAPLLSKGSKPRLRFEVGAKVVCRIKNSAEDGLEQWVPGTVRMIWPELPGEKTWEFDGTTGSFADAVPYLVELSANRLIYCHKDHHTLIRREGLQPQTRLRGISKRMEVRQGKDGQKERMDHMTERSKRILADSDDE